MQIIHTHISAYTEIIISEGSVILCSLLKSSSAKAMLFFVIAVPLEAQEEEKGRSITLTCSILS
jgi:hypothetical protein